MFSSRRCGRAFAESFYKTKEPQPARPKILDAQTAAKVE